MDGLTCSELSFGFGLGTVHNLMSGNKAEPESGVLDVTTATRWWTNLVQISESKENLNAALPWRFNSFLYPVSHSKVWCRKKRLEELRNEKKALTFGAVEQISAVDFVREVTNAGEGIWVVVHLFKDSVPECQVLGLCLEELAAKFPHTKFRRIISTECIPKYPDSNLPTVLIYKDGQCLKSLAGLLPFGGKRTTPEQVAFTLNRFGPICRSEGEEHSAEPTMEELKKFMEKFVIDTIESRDEDADT
uniref:Phosducin-like protein 3 n=1 Tax=Tetraselmis sp. GSL018 TaxID=582737 RepID=A0A061QV81_9CHLO|mmetsp:Transcript_37211/g.88442  ORF Transcript_37211/g.88442 Transcript_37211/m.88442 type:complete len:247 (+) Transcript_37211:512-1252(+)